MLEGGERWTRYERKRREARERINTYCVSTGYVVVAFVSTNIIGSSVFTNIIRNNYNWFLSTIKLYQVYMFLIYSLCVKYYQRK